MRQCSNQTGAGVDKGPRSGRTGTLGSIGSPTLSHRGPSLQHLGARYSRGKAYKGGGEERLQILRPWTTKRWARDGFAPGRERLQNLQFYNDFIYFIAFTAIIANSL